MQPASRAHHNVMLTTQNGCQLVDINSILHCKANGNYTDIFLKDIPNSYITCQTLKKLHTRFNSFLFYRVSRSYLVNFNYIIRFNRQTGKILLASGEEIPVARKKKSFFIKAWEMHAARINDSL
jgi:two-component system, LytTR family, response regulator